MNTKPERQLWEWQSRRCFFCDREFALKDMCSHRLTPKSKGGSFKRDNRVMACLQCDSERSDETPWQMFMGQKLNENL